MRSSVCHMSHRGSPFPPVLVCPFWSWTSSSESETSSFKTNKFIIGAHFLDSTRFIPGIFSSREGKIAVFYRRLIQKKKKKKNTGQDFFIVDSRKFVPKVEFMKMWQLKVYSRDDIPGENVRSNRTRDRSETQKKYLRTRLIFGEVSPFSTQHIQHIHLEVLFGHYW